MIPDKITFTGLELDPDSVSGPRKLFEGTWPAAWTRHQFELPLESYGHLRKIDRWIEQNLEGRWGSYSLYGFENVTYVIAFEKVTDAVMFRISGGEKAWRENATY